VFHLRLKRVSKTIFIQIKVGYMENFSYIVGDEATRLAAVVDPGFDVERILELSERSGLKIKYIILTHEHMDHAQGGGELADKTGAKIVAHEKVALKKDVAVRDGDVLNLGGLKIDVIHTPGHTPGSICLLVDKKLITGDTLFVGGCGRVDLPGGSAEELYHSLFDRLMMLEEDVAVYPGHDYGPKPYSTIGYEKKTNYVLKPRTKEEFLEFMAKP